MSDKEEAQKAALGCTVIAGAAIYFGLEALNFLFWAAELVSDMFTWIGVHFWQILGGITLLVFCLIVVRWLLTLLIQAFVFRSSEQDAGANNGPVLSDNEARRVADHRLGQPEYIQAVTEDPEDGAADFYGMDGDAHEEDPQYRKACQIVFESQKASASWLQRQLRIGYNSAAELIDRMEEDGFIGARDHIGRREVLRDRNGDPV